MNCERADLLIGLMGGDDDAATPAERAEAAAHVEACAACREALEAYRGLSRAVRALPPEAPGAEATARAYAAVLEAMGQAPASTAPPALRVLPGGKAKDAASDRRAWRRPAPWLQGLAAAACLLLVVALAFGPDRADRAGVARSPGADAPATQAAERPADERAPAAAPAPATEAPPAAPAPTAPTAPDAATFGESEAEAKREGLEDARAQERAEAERQALEGAGAQEDRAGALARSRRAPAGDPPPPPPAPARPTPAAGEDAARQEPAAPQAEEAPAEPAELEQGLVPRDALGPADDSERVPAAGAPRADAEDRAARATPDLVGAWRVGDRVLVLERAGAEAVTVRRLDADAVLGRAGRVGGPPAPAPPSAGPGGATPRAAGAGEPAQGGAAGDGAHTEKSRKQAEAAPLPPDVVASLGARLRREARPDGYADLAERSLDAEADAADPSSRPERAKLALDAGALDADLRAILALELRGPRDPAWPARVSALLRALGQAAPGAAATELERRARDLLATPPRPR